MKGFYTLLTVVMLLCLVPAGAAQDGGRQVITPDSANQMVELIRLGRGSTEYVAYSPDGQTIAVASTIGVWLYPAAELNTETEPPAVENYQTGRSDGLRAGRFNTGFTRFPTKKPLSTDNDFL